MKAGWGKDSSRMEVVGMYCLKEMRKDNLVRHNAKIHQGKKEAFSFKTREVKDLYLLYYLFVKVLPLVKL